MVKKITAMFANLFEYTPGKNVIIAAHNNTLPRVLPISMLIKPLKP
jgi:hypothetical protein